MKKAIFTAIFILTFCIFSFGQTQNNPNCPEIKVTGPSSVTSPGETMTFMVNVSDVDLDKIEYQWSVDKGTIIEGQGNPVIVVSTDGLDEATITANVKIKNLPQGCSDSISETGIVAPICILPITLDEFGKLPISDEKARLDAVAVEITARKEEFIAYIILYYPSKKGKKSYENRAARIRKHLIEKRGISSEKVIIISGGDEPEERTRIYLIPAGAIPPTP